jgi:hypothetical protein
LLWWSDVQNFLSETLAFLKQRRELNEQALDINYGVHKATELGAYQNSNCFADTFLTVFIPVLKITGFA